MRGANYDPGAPGVNGRLEAFETRKVRNRVIQILKEMGYADLVQDADGESLPQYVSRIKTGSGSMVIEFHFNAGVSTATGVETLVEVDASVLDIACARELSLTTSIILGIPVRGNRGVKSEADTRHKRLALMKEDGIVVLVEICFITNTIDMAKFDEHFEELCQSYAQLIVKYDDMIQ